MQVLETPELDVIFEYMTQHNQVASLEDIFKVTPPAPPAEKPAAAKPAGKPNASYDINELEKIDTLDFID